MKTDRVGGGFPDINAILKSKKDVIDIVNNLILRLQNDAEHQNSSETQETSE